jgi:hypothetical protein
VDNEREAGMKRAWRWPLAGFIVGGLIGATFLTVNVVGAFVGDTSAVRPLSVERGIGEILHTPPLLVPRGVPLKLVYEAVCGLREDRPGRACDVKGSVFLRAAEDTVFSKLPLGADRGGRLTVTVPPRYLSGIGFDYYAELEDGHGGSASLPSGAHDAPQHVWMVADETGVDLGATRFASSRPPGAVLARAGWGGGDRELGLISGREQARIGPSAFDIAPGGSVVVLDQVNQRLAVFPRGRGPRHLPISFTGGEGDLAIGPDGRIYVLDDGGSQSAVPLVRSVDASGRPVAGAPLAEPTADMLRMGPGSPVVHVYPSEMWLPVGPGRPPLSPAQQVERSSAGRPVAEGESVVVRASPSAARFARVKGDRVVRSWLVTSSQKLGEVQLAEPYGDGLLVVIRVWSEKQAEFRVLRLTSNGLASNFAVQPAEWAETASLSRFRLRGSTLYQLRSGPSGVEIAAYEIGGKK